MEIPEETATRLGHPPYKEGIPLIWSHDDSQPSLNRPFSGDSLGAAASLLTCAGRHFPTSGSRIGFLRECEQLMGGLMEGRGRLHMHGLWSDF